MYVKCCIQEDHLTGIKMGPELVLQSIKRLNFYTLYADKSRITGTNKILYGSA